FDDQFFNDNPSKANNEKTTTDTEAESMMSVTIYQDTSAIPPMTSPVMDLVLYKLENQDIPNQVSKVVDEIVTDAVDWAMNAPLRERFRDLPKADIKEILHNRMWESKSYQAHEDHMTLYEALEKSMARDNRDQLLSDLAEARKKKKKRQGSHKTPPGSPPPPPPPAGPSGTSGASGASGSSQSQPPPPPPSNNQGGQSTSTAAPSSSKTAASAEYAAWTMTDTRLKPSASPIPEELHMDDDTTADEQAYSSSGEDVGRDHIPTVNLRQSWWKPITEDRPATPEPAWSIPSSDLTVPTNNWASALKSSYTPPPENSLLAQIGDMATFMDCKPLPLGGDPGHVTIQPDFFFNKDLEYLRANGTGSDVIVEDASMTSFAMYGISHWWFQRQRFYIDRHTSEGDRRAVRTHMRILSVVRIEVFPMYGYNYMKKIVLRRADLKEYVISKRDFKYLYPSDFEDLYLLNLQGHLNHLSPEDKKILTTAYPTYGPETWIIHNCVEDVQQGDHKVQKIHKFSDELYIRLMKRLITRVKQFRVNRMNPGLDITRFLDEGLPGRLLEQRPKLFRIGKRSDTNDGKDQAVHRNGEIDGLMLVSCHRPRPVYIVEVQAVFEELGQRCMKTDHLEFGWRYEEKVVIDTTQKRYRL
ncbi:hypothetical protein Tco_1165299, partial [Tanacetum coccineum]